MKKYASTYCPANAIWQNESCAPISLFTSPIPHQSIPTTVSHVSQFPPLASAQYAMQCAWCVYRIVLPTPHSMPFCVCVRFFLLLLLFTSIFYSVPLLFLLLLYATRFIIPMQCSYYNADKSSCTQKAHIHTGNLSFASLYLTPGHPCVLSVIAKET